MTFNTYSFLIRKLLQQIMLLITSSSETFFRQTYQLIKQLDVKTSHCSKAALKSQRK